MQENLFINSEVTSMFEALGYVDDGENLLFPLDPTSLSEFMVIVSGYETLLQARVNNKFANQNHMKNPELEAMKGIKE